jgi:hypothetical protein
MHGQPHIRLVNCLDPAGKIFPPHPREHLAVSFYRNMRQHKKRTARAQADRNVRLLYYTTGCKMRACGLRPVTQRRSATLNV